MNSEWYAVEMLSFHKKLECSGFFKKLPSTSFSFCLIFSTNRLGFHIFDWATWYRMHTSTHFSRIDESVYMMPMPIMEWKVFDFTIKLLKCFLKKTINFFVVQFHIGSIPMWKNWNYWLIQTFDICMFKFVRQNENWGMVCLD